MFKSITMIDYRKSPEVRAIERKTFGPYTWTPSKPRTGRGFYQATGRGLACDVAGSTFDLRLEEAHCRCRSRVYRAFEAGVDFEPIIARLPRSRGFLAGWTMGPGMAAAIDSEVYESERDASHAAHDLAHDAATRAEEEAAQGFETIGEEE